MVLANILLTTITKNPRIENGVLLTDILGTSN